MTRRLGNSDNGSLDLLLDTICNTFGGVVFISLLVVVLLNTTSQQASSLTPDEALRSDFLEAENQRRTLSKQLDELREAIAGHETIADIVVAAEAIELARELAKSQDGHAALVAEESKLTGETSQAQQRINELADLAAQQKAELEAAKESLIKLKHQVKVTVEQNARTAVIPKVVMSTQPPQAFFLKSGKLYGPRGRPGGQLNAAEFVIVDVQGHKVLQERSGAGVAVDPRGQQNAAVEGILRDPWLKSFHVKLLVWPDSYEHVEAVRVILDGIDIRCRIEPCEDDTQVILSSEAPGPAHVQ